MEYLKKDQWPAWLARGIARGLSEASRTAIRAPAGCQRHLPYLSKDNTVEIRMQTFIPEGKCHISTSTLGLAWSSLGAWWDLRSPPRTLTKEKEDTGSGVRDSFVLVRCYPTTNTILVGPLQAHLPVSGLQHKAVFIQLKNRPKTQSTEGSAPLELCFFAKTEVGHFVSV
jgi:hypothetical protein